MHEPSRFAWLPLNFASYVVIEDKENPGHYYYGASPMQFLAGISDFAGFQSFATTADPDLNFQMLGYLHNGQYEKIGEILQRMSVKYIIVSRYSLPKAAYDHLNFEGTIDAQKPAYNKLILGDKIKDFGTRYSLYSINKRFTTDKIFLTNNTQSIPADIAVPAIQKSYPYQYDITIHFKEGRTNLAFLEPFDGSWDLFAVDSQGHEYTVNNATHFMIYRFGNGWSFELPKIVQAYPKTLETVNGQKQIHLRIYFHVQKYVQFINEVSVVFWIGIAGYLVIMGIVRFVIFRRNAI
jgi:hypothetical protein